MRSTHDACTTGLPCALPPEPDLVVESFHRYRAMVYHRALRMLGNRADAEEATQDVFIRVMRSGRIDDHRHTLAGWLQRITINHCLNLIARQRRRMALREARSSELAPCPPAPFTELVYTRQLLGQADARQALAVHYVYFDGLSHQEAALRMGVSRRTVGNLLGRFALWARPRIQQMVC